MALSTIQDPFVGGTLSAYLNSVDVANITVSGQPFNASNLALRPNPLLAGPTVTDPTGATPAPVSLVEGTYLFKFFGALTSAGPIPSGGIVSFSILDGGGNLLANTPSIVFPSAADNMEVQQAAMTFGTIPANAGACQFNATLLNIGASDVVPATFWATVSAYLLP